MHSIDYVPACKYVHTFTGQRMLFTAQTVKPTEAT